MDLTGKHSNSWWQQFSMLDWTIYNPSPAFTPRVSENRGERWLTGRTCAINLEMELTTNRESTSVGATVSKVRPYHTGDVFRVQLFHTSIFVLNSCFCHEYFYTEHQYYAAIKWCNFFEQGTFFWAFAPQIKAATNHVVLYTYKDYNTTTRKL